MAGYGHIAPGGKIVSDVTAALASASENLKIPSLAVLPSAAKRGGAIVYDSVADVPKYWKYNDFTQTGEWSAFSSGGSGTYVPSVLASVGTGANLVRGANEPDFALAGLTAGTAIGINDDGQSLEIFDGPYPAESIRGVGGGQRVVIDTTDMTDIQFKGIIGANGITINTTSDPNTVLVSYADAVGPNSLTSVGTALSMVLNGAGPAFFIRRLVGVGGIGIEERTPGQIDIFVPSAGGGSTSLTTTGTGATFVNPTGTSPNFLLKSITAGTNVAVTSSATEVVISSPITFASASANTAYLNLVAPSTDVTNFRVVSPVFTPGTQVISAASTVEVNFPSIGIFEGLIGGYSVRFKYMINTYPLPFPVMSAVTYAGNVFTFSVRGDVLPISLDFELNTVITWRVSFPDRYPAAVDIPVPAMQLYSADFGTHNPVIGATPKTPGGQPGTQSMVVGIVAVTATENVYTFNNPGGNWLCCVRW